MKFRPLHDRVVVKRIDAEEKTAGGIIIPDSAKEKPSQGEVTAVGPGGRDESGKLIPIDLRVGDRVLFGKWSGTEVKINGEELISEVRVAVSFARDNGYAVDETVSSGSFSMSAIARQNDKSSLPAPSTLRSLHW